MSEQDHTAEEWRPVVGYEGWYSVSNMGEVRRECGGSSQTWPGRRCKQFISNVGYMRVGLCRNRITRKFSVHRLVATTFLGLCPDGMQVNHKNGRKTDNRADNLEWMTHTENIRHAIDVLKKQWWAVGEAVGSAKLTANDVYAIRRMCDHHVAPKIIAARFNVSRGLVCLIGKRRIWKHLKNTGIGQRCQPAIR